MVNDTLKIATYCGRKDAVQFTFFNIFDENSVWNEIHSNVLKEREIVGMEIPHLHQDTVKTVGGNRMFKQNVFMLL